MILFITRSRVKRERRRNFGQGSMLISLSSPFADTDSCTGIERKQFTVQSIELSSVISPNWIVCQPFALPCRNFDKKGIG